MPKATYIVRTNTKTTEVEDEEGNRSVIVKDTTPIIPPMISDDESPQLVYDTGEKKQVIHNIDTFELVIIPPDDDFREERTIKKLVRKLVREEVSVMAGGWAACGRAEDGTQVVMLHSTKEVLDSVDIKIEDIEESEDEAG